MGIKTLSFQIDQSADIEDIWQHLEDAGCVLLYSDAGENAQQIFGDIPSYSSKKKLLTQYPEILRIDEIELPEIDWEAQWAVQENYHEGYLHVDLMAYAAKESCLSCPSLKLIPGPGFGDHSHPTTRLVLKLMSSFVLNQDVFDVGCGSGILSLAAVSMGAKSVCGIDIDEAALVHSRANSLCNGMEDKIAFIFPEELTTTHAGSVILMNMIQSEQEIALKSLAPISGGISIAVTSGILCEGRDDYLRLCTKRGWHLVEEMEEEGWLGFVFCSVVAS